jgi:FKBP-type peptidyl-prolyl cis-trans isomerase (trigger factor)
MTQSHKSTNAAYDAASVAVKKLEGAEIEITASIPTETWGAFRKEALKHLNESVSLDGFRKGNIPENVLISKIGEMAVLEEMAELAIPKAYVQILIDQKIDALGRPQISVTKLAANNPLEFKAITAVVPEVKLPDYKKLAAAEIKKAGAPDKKVSDKELDDAILRIRKMHASHEGHDHDKMTPEEHEKAVMANLPELTDDFVKRLGDFKDIPDFKDKLSQMIGEDKANAANEKRRIAIADAITAGTTVDLPKVMVETELDRTQAQFSADVERMGVKLEDYLRHAKKTIEEVRKEWLPHAEKKAKLQLVLNEISKKEDIHPTAAEIEAEVAHIIEHYKDADRERAAVYAETVLTNEKVFEFLEKQGE